MKIIVDAFGGDNAPLAVLKGCALAVKEYGVEILLAGNEKKIRQVSEEHQISLEGMEIVNADTVISMEDEPTEVIKGKADCSMAVGFRLLADGRGEAFVSAGSTGAMVVGASMIVKRIKGVKRAALASVIPNARSCHMLLDLGANVECRPEMLMQFGIMGSAYMEKIMNVQNPKVGLANIGTEETKGGELQLAAHKLLKRAPVNFTGNIEAREIPFGQCDVVVADGFTGNIVLKLTEGLGSYFGKYMKSMFLSSTMTKLAALFMKEQVKSFKRKMDYTEYGGAPLLGIARPVIKAHGSSNEIAFKNAIRQAVEFTQKGIVDIIRENVELASKSTADNAEPDA